MINNSIKKTKCTKCDGSGYMKMKPVVCQKCFGKFHHFCMYCENKGGLQIMPYETCDECSGCGEI